MSIVTLFTRQAPTLGGFEFDAVLEDVLETNVEYTPYPIEVGANAVDHRVIHPIRWRLTGAVSNNPLRPQLTDFVGALSEIIDAGGAVSGLIGLSAGFLAGSNDTRASEALNFLITLQFSAQPIDIDAGDIQLSNMVIVDVSRVKNPENENALLFVADLQELPTLATVIARNINPSQLQLRDGDPAKSQAAAVNDRGEQSLIPLNDNSQDALNNFLGAQ